MLKLVNSRLPCGNKKWIFKKFQEKVEELASQVWNIRQGYEMPPGSTNTLCSN
jgi:hypothetical protein